MAYKIAVASGKGGTGKTTVAVNLFQLMQQKWGSAVHLVDCDVEEPNDLIFYPSAEKRFAEAVTQPIPVIDTQKCTFCKKCVDYCAFNAIVMIPAKSYATVDKTLCHSCGACLMACQYNAITEYPNKIGQIIQYQSSEKGFITEGRLEVGSAMQTTLIKALKKRLGQAQEILLYDAPPGTSCSVVETISDADFVLLVTEPTLFGLHDLRLMVGLLKKMGLPFGVVINKAGLGNRDVYDYLENQGINVWAEIPFDRTYASAYAKAKLLNTIPVSIQMAYEHLVEHILTAIMV